MTTGEWALFTVSVGGYGGIGVLLAYLIAETDWDYGIQSPRVSVMLFWPLVLAWLILKALVEEAKKWRL